jgi:DNA-binding NarL/FixJ family response regulator
MTMQKRQRVLFYGDSLVLAGVRASLETSPAIEVIALDVSHTTEQDLLALNPDIIIFDTHSVRPHFHYDLIQQREELQLIGIDPDNNQVLLLSGQQMRELSMQDLVEDIHKRLS